MLLFIHQMDMLIKHHSLLEVIIDGDDETAVFTSDFVDADMYDNYIDNIKENSTFESQVPIEYGDKVIALVTCSYETNDSRYVLYAKLEKQLINTIEYGDIEF